jgi:hypothetical protein
MLRAHAMRFGFIQRRQPNVREESKHWLRRWCAKTATGVGGTVRDSKRTVVGAR